MYCIIIYIHVKFCSPMKPKEASICFSWKNPQASLRISVHRDVSRRPHASFHPKMVVPLFQKDLGWWNIIPWSDLSESSFFQVTPELITPTGLVTFLYHSYNPRSMVETKKRSVISELEQLDPMTDPCDERYIYLHESRAETHERFYMIEVHRHRFARLARKVPFEKNTGRYWSKGKEATYHNDSLVASIYSCAIYSCRQRPIY